MRAVFPIIFLCMVCGVLSTLVVSGDDEQIPQGDPLQVSLNKILAHGPTQVPRAVR